MPIDTLNSENFELIKRPTSSFSKGAKGYATSFCVLFEVETSISVGC